MYKLYTCWVAGSVRVCARAISLALSIARRRFGAWDSPRISRFDMDQQRVWHAPTLIFLGSTWTCNTHGVPPRRNISGFDMELQHARRGERVYFLAGGQGEQRACCE